jgi:hypothetical protein
VKDHTRHLKPFEAQDGAGNLVKVTVKIPESHRDALDKLSGDRSVHVRAAIEKYLENISNTR